MEPARRISRVETRGARNQTLDGLGIGRRCVEFDTPCLLRLEVERDVRQARVVGQALLDEAPRFRHANAFQRPVHEPAGVRDADDLRISYEEWRKVKSQLQDLLDRERERNRLLDQLRFQTQEIERAELREGEEDELNSEKRKLKNFEFLSQNGASILAALDGRFEEGREGIHSSALVDGFGCHACVSQPRFASALARAGAPFSPFGGTRVLAHALGGVKPRH